MATIVWQEQMLAGGAEVPHILYNGIEKYPIAPEEALQLNFASHINESLEAVGAKNVISIEKLQYVYKKIHRCNWEADVEITPYFTLHKHENDITTVEGKYFGGINGKTPSVIMYDTFSPATQPQLWDVEIFQKIAQNAAAGSILTTYCSKGTVKQALREAGFQLQRLSGPAGKRHILRATL
jgi:tRNA U34 5-methylaminomethyl-2-thiouridine-forming methyltransferase MnmC